MDFDLSPRAREYTERVRDFLETHLFPIEADLLAGFRDADDPWFAPAETEALKAKAREAGLWNLFLPDPELSPGLSVADYAPVAEQTGR